MKANSNEIPKTILNLGNGQYQFNYDVKSIDKLDLNSGIQDISYEYECITVWGYPTYENVVKSAIREKIDETEEFALINDYNSFMLGLNNNENYKTKYKEYLIFLNDLKSKISEYFNNL